MSITAERVARIIGLLSLLVGLAGCSAIKLGYNSLPDLLYWWADGYVDFDDAQSPRVREDLARLHDWHRERELPRYVDLLVRMERLAPGDFTPQQACTFEPELRQRWATMRDQLEPVVVTNALSLAPAQLQHLERKFAGKNREYERDWLSLAPAEQLDKRMKQAQERAETVYGTLTDLQRTALRQHLARMPFDPAQLLAERRRRQQDILAVLRRLSTEPVPLDQARDLVRGLLDRMLDSPDPAYRAYQQALRGETCRTIAELHAGMAPAQREHAARRLRAWQRDLRELASRS